VRIFLALALVVCGFASAEGEKTKFDELKEMYYGEEAFIPALDEIQPTTLNLICYRVDSPNKPQELFLGIEETFLNHGPLFPKERILEVGIDRTQKFLLENTYQLKYEDETLFAERSVLAGGDVVSYKWLFAKVGENFIVLMTKLDMENAICYSFEM
jgi:hypothetical protein